METGECHLRRGWLDHVRAAQARVENPCGQTWPRQMRLAGRLVGKEEGECASPWAALKRFGGLPPTMVVSS
jgi:hypothetical protein